MSAGGGSAGARVARAVAAPFWSVRERRVRALVRIAIHGVALAGVLFGAGWVFALTRGWRGGVVAGFGVETLGVIVVTWLAARFLDRRPFAGLGLGVSRGWALDLGAGVAIGGACMGAIAAIELACGWAIYGAREGGLDGWQIGASFAVFVGVAIVEELTSRGYHLVNLAEGFAGPLGGARRGVVAAVVLSSTLFGLGHAANPNATALAVANVAFGGVFLAVGMLLEGELAIPIGVHLGWNFFQNLLDMPVSGARFLADASAVTRVETGPDLWTGGAFGPEGGLDGIVAMVLGIALTLAWVRVRRGRLAACERLGRPPGALEPGGREVDAPAPP